MDSVCVFCGSSPGNDPAYLEAASALGREIASRGIRLVYGGASVGLMGAVADAAMAAGGEVVGVIPSHLWDAEVGHAGLTDLHVTASMHERKALMAELSEGFLAMPGGFGTLEEVVEILTWGQLGLHHKPIGFLDTAGFYEPLMRFVDHAVGAGFIRAQHLSLFHRGADPAALLDDMATWEPTTVPKWVERT
ncbi:MAG: TIGR00730 family Rossman fold protein [Micrococcales bacterium]|nr:TIGR00730 family Rossman fold protein [Micrococcales bacterium]